MSESGAAFAGAPVPLGTCIAQIMVVAFVHIWAPGQVLRIRAQLQGKGLCPPHSPPHFHFAYGMVGEHRHTSDHGDAGTFPLGG